jgi:DNA-binding MarR family transcriptional regulator
MEPTTFLPALRALVEAYDTFRSVSEPHLEALGLAPPHFDILATLDEEPPMTCKELGERTLLVKGTLSGHLNRLEELGLIQRERGLQDTRQILVSLTARGQAEIGRAFPQHMAFLATLFGRMETADLAALHQGLAAFRRVLRQVGEPVA